MTNTMVKAALFAGLVCLAAADNYNCNTKDAASNWSTGKKAYCCEAIGKGCGGEGPKANGMCTEIGKQWQGMGKACGKDVVTGRCDCEQTGWLCMAVDPAPCKDECDAVRCAEGSEHKCCKKKDECDAVRCAEGSKHKCCKKKPEPNPCQKKKCNEQCKPTCPAGQTCTEVMGVCDADGGKCVVATRVDKCGPAVVANPCQSKNCGEQCDLGCPKGEACPTVVNFCSAKGGKCGPATPKCEGNTECAKSCTSGVLPFDPELHCKNTGCGGCKGCVELQQHNCNTKDMAANWSADKKKFCCQANGKGCGTSSPSPTGKCEEEGAKFKRTAEVCGKTATTMSCDCTEDGGSLGWLCAMARRSRALIQCPCEGKKCGESCKPECPAGAFCTAVMGQCQADNGKCATAKATCKAINDECAAVRCAEGSEHKCCKKKDDCDAVRCAEGSKHKCCKKKPEPNPCQKKKCNEECNPYCPAGEICLAVMGVCNADGGKCVVATKVDKCGPAVAAKAPGRLAASQKQLAMASKMLASQCANATASSTTSDKCKSLTAAVVKAQADVVMAEKAAKFDKKNSVPPTNATNATQPKVGATQPPATTVAATTADGSLSTIELAKLAKEAAEKMYADKNCAATPDTEECKVLQAAVSKATAALEEAEEGSPANALASVSALVAAAAGVAASVVF